MKFMKFVAIFVLVAVITPACSSNSNNIREEGVVAQLIDNQWNAGDTARYFRECADLVYEYQKRFGYETFTEAMYNFAENKCDTDSRHFIDDTSHALDIYDKDCVFDAHINWMFAWIGDLYFGESGYVLENTDFVYAKLDDCVLVLDENYKSNS